MEEKREIEQLELRGDGTIPVISVEAETLAGVQLDVLDESIEKYENQ